MYLRFSVEIEKDLYPRTSGALYSHVVPEKRTFLFWLSVVTIFSKPNQKPALK